MNKNRKVLIKNSFFLSLLQIMRYFIPILVLPYITRIIGVVHFGELAVASSAGLIMQIVVDYGFNYIGTREVATNKTNLPYLSYLYSSITWARCLLFLACSTVMMALTFVIPLFAEIRLLVFISFFPVIMYIFMPEWIYQGLEEMEFITYTNVVSRIVYVILIFMFIKQEDDYILYPIFNIVGLLFASLASLIILYHKNIKLYWVGFGAILKFIKDAKDLFINEICGRLLGNIYNLFIGNFLSYKDAGIYASCAKLFIGVSHGQAILNRVFYPFLAQHGNKFKQYFIINFFISAGASILGFILTPFVYTIFYPEEFNEGINVMRIMAIGLVFSGVSGSLSSNYLIIRKKEKIVRNISAFILVFGTTLFLLCVLRFGLIGAAIGGLVVSIIRCALLAFFSYGVMKAEAKHID